MICRKAGISQATYFNWKKKYDAADPFIPAMDAQRRIADLSWGADKPYTLRKKDDLKTPSTQEAPEGAGAPPAEALVEVKSNRK